MMKVLLVLAALIAVSVAQTTPTWTPVRTNIGQICPGLDFWSQTSGYVLDFVSGPGPLLLRTDDGGQTLTQAMTGIKIMILVDIVTANSGNQALTGGVSLLNEPISVQTNNGGSTWNTSSTHVISSTFANIDVLANGAVALFGNWEYKPTGGKATTYYGFVLSNDNGNTYDFFSWPYSGVDPVGGSFVGNNFVAIAGSAAPVVEDEDDDANAAGSTTKSLKSLVYFHKRQVVAPKRAMADFPANETYRSYVAVSSDAGSTWKTVFKSEGTDNITGISLGSLKFVSTTVGFVTGTNHTAAGSAAFVLGTQDGGNNWATLLQVPDAIFTRIECVSATNCFVVGGIEGTSLLGTSVVYETNDAGKTFTQTTIPKVSAFVDISVVSPGVMYATAVTAFQTCDLYYYGPAQSTSA